MGKDMKIKHSVSSPPKYGDFYLKKGLHGGANLSGQIYRRLFYMGTNDKIMPWG